MENIKMIVTDLDQTLLNNESEITEYSKEVLEKCMEKGIIVVFATARPIRATDIFFPIIKPHAVICHNGAKVLSNDKLIYHCGINPKICDKIIFTLSNSFSKINLAVEINEKIYANFDPSIYWGKMVYYNLNNKPNEYAEKILVGINEINEADEVIKILPDALYFEKSKGAINGNIGLIMNKKATKWNAIKKLAKHYKLSIQNILSFGDNENDFEMVKNCGIGVAVENGIEEVKKAATYICGINGDNGVAKWIESNLLEKTVPGTTALLIDKKSKIEHYRT